MRTLLYLLFLACLGFLVLCADLVRWSVSHHLRAQIFVRRERSLTSKMEERSVSEGYMRGWRQRA